MHTPMRYSSRAWGDKCLVLENDLIVLALCARVRVGMLISRFHAEQGLISGVLYNILQKFARVDRWGFGERLLEKDGRRSEGGEGVDFNDEEIA